MRRISPVFICLFYRQADWAITSITVFPMTDDLPRHTTVRHGAIFASLTIRHVIQNIFHGFTVRQGALSHLAVRLTLASLTFMRMQK